MEHGAAALGLKEVEIRLRKFAAEKEEHLRRRSRLEAVPSDSAEGGVLRAAVSAYELEGASRRREVAQLVLRLRELQAAYATAGCGEQSVVAAENS